MKRDAVQLTLILIGIVLLFWLMSLPAQGHTETEIEEVEAEYVEAVWMVVERHGGLNTGAMVEILMLVREHQNFMDRHPCHYHNDCPTRATVRATARRAPTSFTGSAETWRGLVSTYFSAGDVDTALCLIHYESRGNPDAVNPSSGASGLFQHLPKYWADRSTKAGWSGASIFDPTANIAVAAWLKGVGGWGHWSPWNRGLCRGL